jgi:hypothetical protein
MHVRTESAGIEAQDIRIFRRRLARQINQFRNLRLRGLSKQKPRRGVHVAYPAPAHSSKSGRQIVLAVPLSRAWVGLMRLRPSSSVPRKKTRIWRVWRPLGPCLEEIMVNDGQLLADSGPFCGVALWLVRSADGGCHVLRERLNLFDDEKKAEDTQVVKERRASLIDRLLNVANRHGEMAKADKTPVKQVAPSK